MDRIKEEADFVEQINNIMNLILAARESNTPADVINITLYNSTIIDLLIDYTKFLDSDI
jgi:hypothetical protein